MTDRDGLVVAEVGAESLLDAADEETVDAYAASDDTGEVSRP